MNSRMIFILGTGRCGTKTLADALNSFENIEIIHEQTPPLIKEAKEYLTGSLSHEKVAQIIKETRTRKDSKVDIHGESNNRLSVLLSPLSEAFPDARYIWLIRDGRTNVASIYHRRTYSHIDKRTNEWIKYRLNGNEVDNISNEEWNRMSSFAHVCWTWAYINTTIENQLNELKLKHIIVKLEELVGCWDSIVKFIGIDEIKEFPSTHSNRTQGSQPRPWQFWSKTQRYEFEKYAGDTMDRYYDGWREEMNFSIFHEYESALYRTIEKSCKFLGNVSRPIRYSMRGKKRRS